MVPGRRLLSLTFLSQQSFGYCPRAKRSRGNTRAGPVGYLFETVHNAIAPVWQPGAYIRSCELSSVVERAHSNVARKTKGWVERPRKGSREGFVHNTAVQFPIVVASDRIGLLPIASHVMRSKKQSMLKGFSSGGWAKRRKPNPDRRRRLLAAPGTCSARMHPRGNHGVQTT